MSSVSGVKVELIYEREDEDVDDSEDYSNLYDMYKGQRMSYF